MKFALQNSYDVGYATLGDLTWYKNKRKYCEKHGYSPELHIYSNPPFPHSYMKMFHVKELLKYNKLDWVWVTGCDSMITNMTIKLEDIVDHNYHLIIATDVNGLNADSFLIRNSDEGRYYINYIISCVDVYKDHHWAEQQAMMDSQERFKSITKFVPQRTFNSYNYDFYPQCAKPNLDKLGTDGNWQHGDFLIHWPGQPLDRRLKHFERYSQSVIYD